MSDVEESWQTVAGEFRNLGYAFRDHYRATKDHGDEVPSDEEVRNALHTVTEAVDTALTSVGRAIRDPEVQQGAKEAAKSFVDALGVSFSQMGEALDRAVSRVRTTSQPEPPPVSEEPEGPDPVD